MELEPIEFNLTPDEVADLLAKVHNRFGEQQAKELSLPMVVCPELYARWQVLGPILRLDPSGAIPNPDDQRLDREGQLRNYAGKLIDLESIERWTLQERNKPMPLTPKYAQKLGESIQEFVFFRLNDKPGPDGETKTAFAIKVVGHAKSSTVYPIVNDNDEHIKSRCHSFLILLGEYQRDSLSTVTPQPPPQKQEIITSEVSAIKQTVSQEQSELAQQPDKKKPRAITRITGSLIKWYAEVSEIGIDDAADELEIPNGRYYKHSKSIATDEEISQLGTSWEELLEKAKVSLSALEEFLRKKLRERAVKRK